MMDGERVEAIRRDSEITWRFQDGEKKASFLEVTLDIRANIPTNPQCQQTVKHYIMHLIIDRNELCRDQYTCTSLVFKTLVSDSLCVAETIDLSCYMATLRLTVMSQTVLYSTNMCCVEIMNLHFNEQQ